LACLGALALALGGCVVQSESSAPLDDDVGVAESELEVGDPVVAPPAAEGFVAPGDDVSGPEPDPWNQRRLAPTGPEPDPWQQQGMSTPSSGGKN
jgi:hypothetical protein